MKKIILVPLAILLVVITGCNMPGTITQSPDVAYTAAAQTVQAALTQIAPSPIPPTPLATPTAVVPPTPIPIPTNTTVPSPTTVPIPCNRATYNAATIDVTYPDGTTVAANSSFTKTWRLINAGTCTWTSGYQLVFHQGDAMGVPAGYAQSLTSGTVPPGGSVDISVNLIAPATTGSYKGYWRLREPGGEYFGIGNAGGNFWVSITVSGDTILTVNPVAAESGLVRSDATLQAGLLNVGDTAANLGTQVFLSFDISSIPAGSTIKSVKFDMSHGYDVLGTPLSSLGCLRFYAQNYGTLDAGDFVIAPPAGALSMICHTADIAVIIIDDKDWKAAAQAQVGTTRFQFRMQFPDKVSDMNGKDDMVRLGTVSLIITYKKP
jgi:hypothetical protein